MTATSLVIDNIGCVEGQRAARVGLLMVTAISKRIVRYSFNVVSRTLSTRRSGPLPERDRYFACDITYAQGNNPGYLSVSLPGPMTSQSLLSYRPHFN
jgi:hypothetical protein